MLEWDTPELDRTKWGSQNEHEMIQELHQIGKQKNIKNFDRKLYSYLNEGTGEPCTGQTRLALFDIFEDNLASIMLDLLGPELPMGSEEDHEMNMTFTNLNVGIGEPWTGQLKLSDIDVLTVTTGGIRLDNLGADPPMGSGITATF